MLKKHPKMFVDMLGSNSLRLSKLIYDVYFNKYNFEQNNRSQ